MIFTAQGPGGSNAPESESEGILESIQLTQAHMRKHLDRIPALVESATESFINSNQKGNNQRVGIGITVGNIISWIGSDLARTSDLEVVDIINRAGDAVASGSFAADRIINFGSGLPDATVTCGIQDYQNILGKYDVLFALDEMYAPYIGQGACQDQGLSGYGGGSNGLPEDLQPEALIYHATYYGIDARDSVACVIGSSQKLVNCIDVIVSDLKSILNLYAKLLKVSKEECNRQPEAPTGYGAPVAGYGQPAPAPVPSSYGQPAPSSYNQPAPAPAPSSYSQPAAPASNSYSQPAPAPAPSTYSQPAAPAPSSYSQPAPAPALSSYSQPAAPAPSSYSQPAPAPSTYSQPSSAPSSYSLDTYDQFTAPSTLVLDSYNSVDSPVPGYGSASKRVDVYQPYYYASPTSKINSYNYLY